MSISKDEYGKMADKASPNSPVVLNCVKAFLFGGGICCFGQLLNTLYQNAGMSGDEVKAATPCTIIIITAILTGIGVFDKIACHAGAGTVVPITGFANAVVSRRLSLSMRAWCSARRRKCFRLRGRL